MDGVFCHDDPKIVPCDKGYSFFHDLVEKRWAGNGPLHRLCSLSRKMRVKSFVLEELVPNREILEEADAIGQHPDLAGQNVTARASRLSFFRSQPKDWRQLTSQDFLGYAVVVEMRRNGKRLKHKKKPVVYVLESVVRPPTLFLECADGRPRPKSAGNYYVHCIRTFPTLIGKTDDNLPLCLEGSFFCQQNALTHVCAHAALRMAINSSPSINGKKLTNAKINQLLGIRYSDAASLDALRKGLRRAQIEQVVEALGMHSMSFEFPNPERIGYAEYIYPLIESRFPVILGIEGMMGGHVVAVLGHTINSDRWEPQARRGYGSFPLAQYYSSAAWADHFIISDDNYGMYVTLPRDMVRNFVLPEFDPNLHAAMAVGLVPQAVRVNGYDAESLGARVIEWFLAASLGVSPACRWLGFLRGRMKKDGRHVHPTVVCRTVLTDRARYCKEMAAVEDSEGAKLTPAEVQKLRSILPSKFWVSEVSLPDLYTANKHKIGDVIINSASGRDRHRSGDSLVFAWLPGIARCGPRLVNIIPSWSLKGHIRVLRHVDGPLPALEW